MIERRITTPKLKENLVKKGKRRGNGRDGKGMRKEKEREEGREGKGKRGRRKGMEGREEKGERGREWNKRKEG